MKLAETNNQIISQFFGDVCTVLINSCQRLATFINAEICQMNWQVSKRIKEDVFFIQRAEYGKQDLKRLSENLSDQFGNGWSVFKQ